MKARIILVLIVSYCTFVNGQTEIKNSYSLPKIKEFKYVSIPTALERIFPPNSCQQNLVKFLKNYHKRLTDINGIEVYLVKQNCDFSQNTCLCFETTAQGEFNFLVLFNRKLKEANVLVCSFDFLSDSEVYNMHFKIKRNEIKLTESGITEGEKGAEEFSKKIFKILILKNGQIRVNSKKEL